MRLGQLLVAYVDARDHGLGQVDEGLPRSGVDVQRSRLTFVTVIADALHKGNLGQQRHTHLLSQLLTTVLAEDVIFIVGQFSRRKPCHVLHQSEDRYVDFVVGIHVDTLTCIGQRHMLRRRDDDGSRDGQRLEQREMDVGCAWRRVEHKVVEIAPVGVGDELLE